MAFDVQSVANGVNVNCREAFCAYNVAVDVAVVNGIILPWVESIHKDVLHTSVWSNLLTTSSTFTSSPNGSPYTLSATNIRRILSVYDVANRRILLPYQDATFPAGTSAPPERSGPPRNKFDQTEQTNSLYPQYYLVEANASGSGTVAWSMHLFSDPKDNEEAGTVRYFYTKTINALTDSTSVLLLPLDANELVLAGVTMYAMQYLKRPLEAAWWQAWYTQLKKGF